jgi:hypothetical protein
MRRRFAIGLVAIAALCILGARRSSSPADPSPADHDSPADAPFTANSHAHRAPDPQSGPAVAATIHHPISALDPSLITDLPESLRDQPWRAPFYCPADFNKDDRVDDQDIELFFAVLAAQDGPMAPWLDMDGDAAVTGEDVAWFLSAVATGECDPAARARLREQVTQALVAHRQDYPTVTLSEDSVYVSGNGFSMTAQLGPNGTITTMEMVEVSISALNLARMLEGAGGMLERREPSQLTIEPMTGQGGSTLGLRAAVQLQLLRQGQ